MDNDDISRLRTAVDTERVRLEEQVAALQATFDGIVEGTELTSNDDEHDPEGTTIAYERAQVAAMLRQAQDDLVTLHAIDERIADNSADICENCGQRIAFERLIALPGTTLCVNCAP